MALSAYDLARILEIQLMLFKYSEFQSAKQLAMVHLFLCCFQNILVALSYFL